MRVGGKRLLLGNSSVSSFRLTGVFRKVWRDQGRWSGGLCSCFFDAQVNAGLRVCWDGLQKGAVINTAYVHSPATVNYKHVLVQQPFRPSSSFTTETLCPSNNSCCPQPLATTIPFSVSSSLATSHTSGSVGSCSIRLSF